MSIFVKLHCTESSFQITAGKLKSTTYMDGCHTNSAAFPIKWIDERDGDKLVETTYTDCRPKSGADGTTVDPAYKKNSSARQTKVPHIPLDPYFCEYFSPSKYY
jgi:hypothetical protein